mmetsp:Transcript_135834/g.240145  ORF Transcript_135834/g.240145 Transcript_135834/m.240145 type:complete len:755 (+) Transcript_135834:111-2375(+)
MTMDLGSGMSVDAEVLKNLPNLPGFALPTFKERNHKSQTWGIVNGQRIEQKEGLSHDRQKFVQAIRPQDQWRSGSLPDSTTRAVFGKLADKREYMEVPAWDALDRHVLRFTGYFKEAVVETNLENYRVRKVVLFYYLEDDTCHITEPRQDNSGIPQGTLIRRHRFPGPNGGYLKPEDIIVGQDLHIYGKTIRLTDCDPFTRQYYQHVGMMQEDPIPDEVDPFIATREEMKTKSAAQPRTYEKLYREVMLGGGHINADMQQFLEKDKKVLRFFAVLDDLSTPQFERRPFTLLFFLADDTVEIREQYPLNCGRDNFPIFFRRGKMPKGKVEVHGPMAPCKSKDEYVQVTDLSVGVMVNLQGYQFYIYDADDFTRMYFKEELSLELPSKNDVQLPERAVPRPATPPYTGFGSWDDSMTSVLHLIPKAPKKDFNKLYRNDGKILRFTARFCDPKPEDAERLFVVNFHLFDDTLSIHEPPQRNLGIVTGKFLEKNVHLNQMTGAIYKPEDLMPGKIISVHNRRFEICDMDEYTRKFYDGEKDGHDRLDLSAVLEKLREGMRQQFPLIRDIFRKFDSDHDGVLTQGEFKQALEKYGFQLTDEETLIIMKHFDTRHDGQVTYNEFCDALLDEDYTTSMMKLKPALKQEYDHTYAEKAAVKTEERAETEAVRQAVRAISDVIYKQSQTMAKLLKEFAHMTHEHTVNVAQIQEALLQIGKNFSFDEVQRCVLFVLPQADLERIKYIDFLKAMVATYHDMCCVR